MNHKHIFAGCITTIAVCGTSVALGFGQPDGIDPPAGPVGDTQPSLTSISEQINSLAVQVTGETNLGKQIFDLPNGQSESVSTNNILLTRIIMQAGRATITDANNQSYLCDADEFIDQHNDPTRTNNFTFEFGVEMQGPVIITGNDGTLARLVVIYKELP